MTNIISFSFQWLSVSVRGKEKMRERPLEDSAREGYKQANNKMQNKQKALRQCRENVKKVYV